MLSGGKEVYHPREYSKFLGQNIKKDNQNKKSKTKIEFNFRSLAIFLSKNKTISKSNKCVC